MDRREYDLSIFRGYRKYKRELFMLSALVWAVWVITDYMTERYVS
jgi:hypothetical protein